MKLLSNNISHRRDEDGETADRVCQFISGQLKSPSTIRFSALARPFITVNSSDTWSSLVLGLL